MDNKLSLHLGKTESILFRSNKKINKVESFEEKCGNETINHVKSVKYFGLQIDNDLTGKSFVNDIIQRANSRLIFVYRCKEMLNFESRKTLCSDLIQCHFDYSCFSWYPGVGKGIANQELVKTGFLIVPGRVKQLKLGHNHKNEK
ncbi:unnamed protein product [Meganyctiphanes norvegica]|uniref:Uncharacterized protein n=1 Tax=Meganyctiphanes norvegica TaxID=48144 RepID=A0AAV2RCS8_MEGNR